ncbi:MAG: EamA family transporter [Christensenellaceae bacterium]|jgi:transporter family protein|nr:EamA family transporter [Christensenellaceae bacterium]
MYIVFAALSAVFSALTAILSKRGLKNINPNLAVFIRTGVVLLFIWGIVFATGVHTTIQNLTNTNILYLTLSGCATGCSWLCYFKALSIGNVNKVAAVDKSSVTLSMIIAFIFLHESITMFKIAGLIAVTAGTYLMLDKKTVAIKSEDKNKYSWFIFALLSAVFAALTSILAKVGLKGVNSDLGTAIRTCVVFVFAGIVAVISIWINSRQKAKGFLDTNESTIITAPNDEIVIPHKKLVFSDKKGFLFLLLSGIATGSAWIFYFRALNLGEASVVAPIDKTSIVFTVLASWIILKEKVSKKTAIGLIILSAGGILVVF